MDAEFLKKHPELDLKFYTIGVGFAGGEFNLREMNCLWVNLFLPIKHTPKL